MGRSFAVTRTAHSWRGNNSGVIDQQQSNGDQMAPGFEALAEAVAHVMQSLATVELTDVGRQVANEAAGEIVAEGTSVPAITDLA
jgi:hypothetical protein